MSGTQRRYACLTCAYVGVLIIAAALASRSPEHSWEATVWGSVIASFPLAFFGLGGNELRQERMASPWWFLIPQLEWVSFLGCFLIGMAVIRVLLLRILERARA